MPPSEFEAQNLDRDAVSSLESITYTPLNIERQEIRVLTFEFPNNRNGFPALDTIALRLEHVSLLDYTLQYHAFKSGVRADIDPPELYQQWIESRGDPGSGFETHRRFNWGEYSTLSYNWGPSLPARVINVNGSSVLVGQNLESALRAIRNYTQREWGLKIWVDALCINQLDEQEKNLQVKRMRNIYSGSAVTRIWIGNEDEEISPYFSFFQLYDDIFISASQTNDAVLDEFFSDGCSTRSPASMHSQVLGEDGYDAAGPGEAVNSIVNGDCSKESFELSASQKLMFAQLAIHHLFKRTYWKRVWIMQELAVSGQWAPIHCGSRIVPWFYLTTLISYMRRRFELFPTLVTNEEVAAACNLVTTIVDWQRQAQSVSDDGLIDFASHWIYLGLRGQSTLLGDKIYALLGLFPATISDKIVPDYSLSPEDVYVQLCGQLICQSGDLDIICTPDPDRPADFPSWAINPRGSPNRSVNSNIVKKKLHAASAQLRAETELSSDGRILKCYGFKVDIIDGTSTSIHGMDVAKDRAKCEVMDSHGIAASREDWKSRYRTKMNREQHAYKDGEELRYALQSCLLLNDEWGGDIVHQPSEGPRDPSTQLDPAFEGHEDDISVTSNNIHLLTLPWVDPSVEEDPMITAMKHEGWNRVLDSDFKYYRTFHTFRQANADFLLYGRTFRSFFPAVPEEVGTCKDFYPNVVAQAAVLQSLERKLVTTVNGLIGSAVTMARQGDAIYILRGCSMPMILRPEGSHLEVIGTVYVHGLMRGEAIERMEAGELEWEELELC